MNAQRAYAAPKFCFSTLPVRNFLKPKRDHRPSLFSGSSLAETIEIVERSGRKDPVSDKIASLALCAVGASMTFAVLAAILLCVPSVLEAQSQFNVEDLVRVVAGR